MAKAPEETFRPQFTIIDESATRLKVKIRTENEDPLRDWLPFITWDGSYEESFPLATSFTAPANRKEEIIQVLTKRGFGQSFGFIMAKF